MSEAELRRLNTAEQVAAEACALLTESLWARPQPTVCLPAGRTPLLLYALLREAPEALRASGALLFQLDEIVGTSPASPTSFAHFLREELLGPLDWNANGRLLDGSAPDAAGEIRRHAKELRAAGGIDVAVLGLGTNGHVAFNEPGSEPEDGARVVSLSARTREALTEAGVVAEFGITLGLRELLAARRLVLLVTGESKAPALRRMLEEPEHPVCPASFLRNHPGLVILADRPAASQLAV